MLKVYYDGACLVCHHEMQVYQKKDKKSAIEFIDISTPEFKAEKEGLDTNSIQKSLHTKKDDGSLHTGVDSFINIWEALEIMPLARAALKKPVIKKISELGYYIFAEKIRPHLPKRRCDSQRCQL